MGQRTFESIGKRLPGRTTIVVSKTLRPEGCLWANCLEDVDRSQEQAPSRIIFLCGGDGSTRTGSRSPTRSSSPSSKATSRGTGSSHSIGWEFHPGLRPRSGTKYDVHVYSRRALQELKKAERMVDHASKGGLGCEKLHPCFPRSPRMEFGTLLQTSVANTDAISRKSASRPTFPLTACWPPENGRDQGTAHDARTQRAPGCVQPDGRSRNRLHPLLPL